MLEKFQAEHFRNLDSSLFVFQKGLNFILGENAQGKTNLLEAIDLFIRGKSFKKSLKEEFFNFAQPKEKITLKGIWKGDFYTRSLFFEKKDPFKQLSDTFVIEPLNHFIFLKEEAKKRLWFDEHFSLLSSQYSKEFTQVKKILFQKAYYLKNFNEKMLFILNEQLTPKLVFLYEEKLMFFEKIKKLVSFFFKNLFDENKELKISFESPFFNYEETQNLLKKNLQEEIRTRKVARTLSLEKYTFFLNEKCLENFGSLGQRKLAYLSLCFSWLSLYKDYYNFYPLILFDDFSGEIDIQRERNLIEVIETYPQVFLTTVDKRIYKGNVLFLKEGQLFHEKRL